MRRLQTTYSTLTWSADGTQVTKERPDPARYEHELRVNRLLVEHPPPVAFPRLVGFDRRSRALTFEALPGDPVGPKYPLALAPATIDEMADLARAMQHYRPPRRRWFRRLDVARRLRSAARAGLLTDRQAAALTPTAAPTCRFQHGDLTARNVMRTDRGLHLIDWEWAGLYPAGYDLAFLWFSLIDVPGGRDRIDCDPRLALIVQLWHLQWFVPPEFRDAQLRSRDELLARLL